MDPEREDAAAAQQSADLARTVLLCLAFLAVAGALLLYATAPELPPLPPYEIDVRGDDTWMGR